MQLDVGEGLLKIQNQRKTYVAMPVGNNTKHAVTLPRKNALGSIHPIEKVIETDSTDKHKTNVKVNSVPPLPIDTKQTLWEPPVDIPPPRLGATRKR